MIASWVNAVVHDWSACLCRNTFVVSSCSKMVFSVGVSCEVVRHGHENGSHVELNGLGEDGLVDKLLFIDKMASMKSELWRAVWAVGEYIFGLLSFRVFIAFIVVKRLFHIGEVLLWFCSGFQVFSLES